MSKKITDYSSGTPVTTDVLEYVSDPGGTPASKKTTVAALFGANCGTNVATALATFSSSNIKAACTDETGSGALVFADTPTLVTPVLGAATGTSVALSSFGSFGGGTVSTTGNVRVASTAAVLIGARIAANTSDLSILELDGSNGLLIGTDASTTAAKQVSLLRLWSTTTINIGVASATLVQLTSAGLGSYQNKNLLIYGSLNTAPGAGGGLGVLAVANAGTNPGSTPSGGGVLYSDTGAGKWKGSGGTVTTFGPAEPHCPSCGTDVGISQSENDIFGDELIHCLACELKTGNGVVRHYADFFDRRAA